MWSKKAISQLDKYYPPCGACMLCGFKDKRHRLWDTWLDMPEDDETLARIYDADPEHIKLVRQIRPFHREGSL